MIERHNMTSSAPLQLSAIIPSHNSAPWLPATLVALDTALGRIEGHAQVVIVDDGSTDDTKIVIDGLPAFTNLKIEIISQLNLGRFRARLNGLHAAKHDVVLLLDSRVLIDKTAFEAIQIQLGEVAAKKRAINAHVRLPADSPLLGWFWEIPTHIFWSDYLSNPRLLDLTPQNFDRVPKGMGMFLADRSQLLSAFEIVDPEEELSLISDDTRILRRLSRMLTIQINPEFSGIYLPRISIRKFIRHSFDRGSLFVDSYAGTSVLRNVILLTLIVAPIGLLLLILSLLIWQADSVLTSLVAALIALPLLVSTLGMILRAPVRAAISFCVYFYPFGLAFWLGLIRGALLHRRLFRSGTRQEG